MPEIFDLLLSRGSLPGAPPRVLGRQRGEGPLYRRLRNWRPHDGVLKRREALRGNEPTPPTIDLNGTGNEQFPLVIQMIHPSYPANVDRWVVVTNRELWLVHGGNWTNVTPIYTQGTIETTGASSVVTGTGTDWLTKFIVVGQLIQIDGSWFKITAVTSDTSITVSGTPNAVGPGAGYTIRRTFNGSADVTVTSLAFVRTLREDVYVAGNFIVPGDTLAVPVAAFGIIKITDAANVNVTSFSPGTYVAAGEGDPTNNGTADVDELGYSMYCSGFEILPDGRLYVVGQAFIIGSSYSRARAIWSDPADPTIWTASPAGDTDLLVGSGPVTALGVFGGFYTHHFQSGIALGEFTGRDAPPMNYTETRATTGALNARNIIRVEGGGQVAPGEIFLGRDRRLWAFDGLATRIAPAPLAEVFRDGDSLIIEDTFLSHDPHRGEVVLTVRGGTIAGTVRPTQELRYGYRDGHFYECEYDAVITAAELGAPLGDTEPLVTNKTRRVGLPSWLNSVSSDMIYALREDELVDNAPNQTNGVSQFGAGIYAETDTLDLGAPGLMKLIHKIELHYQVAVSTAGTTFYLGLLREGETAWETVSKSLVLSNLGTVETPGYEHVDGIEYFYFTERSAESFRLRIGRQATGDYTAGTQPIWPYMVRIYWSPKGDRQAMP